MPNGAAQSTKNGEETVSQRKEWVTITLLLVLVLAVFWKAVLGGIFYFGDIYNLHYPLRAAYARELARLDLPLWSPDVLAGYPLLAEGQLGALYPPNLILHFLLPVPIALNVFILGHLVWAAIAAYAFARWLKLSRPAALCTGLVYALGGFTVAHLDHVNILASASWMPWLLLMTGRLMTNRSGSRLGDAVALALFTGLELLAGHVQIAVLTLLAVAAYALYMAWMTRASLKTVGLFAVSLAVGACLAAVQLLPSYELTQLSVRAGGLDPTFSTSFSLHPAYLVGLVFPFFLGSPSPRASVEYVAYLGLLPLLLVLLAPLTARLRAQTTQQPLKQERFFAVLAAVALFLALGRWNPVYTILTRVPVLSLFRVPARYLYWFSLSAAVLAGLGFDAVLGCTGGDSGTSLNLGSWLLIVLAAASALLATLRASSVDDLVVVWSRLPLALAILSLAWLVWARWRKQATQLRAVVALVLIVVDLVAFNAVYSRTNNQTMSLQEFAAQPRSLAFLRSQEGVYRLYTNEQIVPWLSVMRESYYWNTALVDDQLSGNGSFPLMLARYAQFTAHMTPRMLDLLGVRYFLIPQVLPVDEASESYDLQDPFALNPVGRSVAIQPTQVLTVEVESYLSHSVDWVDGQQVAQIVLQGTQGEREAISLQAGWHTSEWAYDRSDVSLAVRHAQAPVARTWPARSGFPPENHRGYTYRAVFRLKQPLIVQNVEVQALVPSAYLRIERLALSDAAGRTQLLSHLENQGDHTLAYRSEDVAVYENHDVLPRAFVVHEAQAVPDDEDALLSLQDPAFDPAAQVLLASGSAPLEVAPSSGTDQVQWLVYDSRRVALQVRSAGDGYLVLTDSWYPGWRASVDGHETPVVRADLVFRAIFLPAGEHRVEFSYAPSSFQMGLLISLAALAVLFVLGVVARWAARAH